MRIGRQSASRAARASTAADAANVDPDDPDRELTPEERVLKEVRDLQYILPNEAWRFNLADAFFLHYAVGCLDIDLLDGRGSGAAAAAAAGADRAAAARLLEEHKLRVWRTFCALQRTFVEKYVTNCHYRSLGWFVRSGLQFGATFVMYREHPMACHSELCGLVVCDAPDTYSPVPSWLQAQCHSRLSVQVNKKCIFVIVSRPTVEECLRAPAPDDILRQCAIEMVTLGRFVPEAIARH